jgi:hypothetical protein
MCVENDMVGVGDKGKGMVTPLTYTSQTLLSTRDIRIYQKMVKALTGVFIKK